MSKNTYKSYKEFKAAFPNATELKKKGEEYPMLLIFETTKTGKINKHVRPVVYSYLWGTWKSFSTFNEVTSTNLLKTTIPSIAKRKNEVMFVFRKRKLLDATYSKYY